MNKVKIITDSCADIGADLLEEYDIDYVRMSITEDGKESPALLTWSAEDAHRLFDTIRGGKRIMTAQVSVEEFTTVFTKYLDEGRDIVYIGCSSKQSGSVNTGHVIAQKLLSKYPGALIYCIDSLNASMGEGMLAVEAAKLARQGFNADKIQQAVFGMRKKVNQFVTVHTLDHLKKAGRVSASSAFFGNLMGVKPILIADANGVQTPIKKVRGRQTSFAEIVKCLKECITEPENQTIYIAHADCSKEELNSLVSLVKKEIPCKDVYVGFIGPIIGASIGPDAVGVWGFGKTVTYKVGEK
jgi:DegV family protein with EDD domain